MLDTGRAAIWCEGNKAVYAGWIGPTRTINKSHGGDSDRSIGVCVVEARVKAGSTDVSAFWKKSEGTQEKEQA